MIVREKLTMTLRRLTDLEFARAKLRSGDLDGAIALARQVLDEQFATGEMIFRGPATACWARHYFIAGQNPTSRKPRRRLTG